MSRISTFIEYAFKDHSPFDYQAAFINDLRSRFLWIEAARQVGKSVMTAHKATALALAVPGYKHIWCSYTLDDCKEKIEYANELYDRMREFREFRSLPDRIVDNRLEVKFSNGSRLMSTFIPRGKSKADVTLDEFAHMPNPRKIWRAAAPILIHGGQFVVMSTPTHGRTMFARIGRRENGKFRAFKRARLYWWDCPIHCRDVNAARREAPNLPTDERVMRFGTSALIHEFENNFLEDFQQEFELTEIDDNVAYLAWELVLRCAPGGEDAVEPCASIAELQKRCAGRMLFAGYDVGRRHDAAELSVFSLEGGRLVERYAATLRRKEFDIQFAELEALMKNQRVLRLKIDETGLGMNLAENLKKKFAQRVIPVSFTNPTKAALASNMRMLMELDKVRFQASAEKNYQMHSVKKEITASDNVRLVVNDDSDQADERHHADVFWSRALALSAYSDKEALGKARILSI